MKLTAHNGRVDSSGLHNDRNYDVNQSPHINQERMKDNKFYTYNGETGKTLNEIELEFYKEHFTEGIKRQNEKNTIRGHKERNKTIKQFYKGQHTRPEDKILQIGDRNTHVDAEILWECALEFQKRFDEIFGSNCKILDMSLHVDEETPHVHIRRVWLYKDEDGIERVGQTKALQELGILAQDTTKQEGRFNNAKMTFTSQERELFRNICLEKGINLEPDTPSKRKHLSVPEYKELKEEIGELEKRRIGIWQDINDANNELNSLSSTCEAMESFLTSPMFHNIHDEEVAFAKKKNMAKRAAVLAEIFKEEADKITASEGSFRAVMEEAYQRSKGNNEVSKLENEVRKLNHKVEILSQFIVEEGLGEKFVDYTKRPKDRGNSSPHKTLL